VRRQLLRLQTQALGSHVDMRFLQEQERQQLKTGDCRCYLARDSGGAVTLFLALTFGDAEEPSAVQSEYARSLELGDGTTILQESGMNQPNNQGLGFSEKQLVNRHRNHSKSR
jgi:hypothetical protein